MEFCRLFEKAPFQTSIRTLQPVLWIRIQIRMFLGLLYPDTDPDPSSFYHQAEILIKTLIPTASRLLLMEMMEKYLQKVASRKTFLLN
jgi:hypothetical protein